jgi:hypothetical protein
VPTQEEEKEEEKEEEEEEKKKKKKKKLQQLTAILMFEFFQDMEFYDMDNTHFVCMD